MPRQYGGPDQWPSEPLCQQETKCLWNGQHESEKATEGFDVLGPSWLKKEKDI